MIKINFLNHIRGDSVLTPLIPNYGRMFFKPIIGANTKNKFLKGPLWVNDKYKIFINKNEY